MSKRESILLIVMGVGLLIGAYYYLFANQQDIGTDAKVNYQELNSTVDMVKGLANKDEFTEVERYKLELAETKWPSNPFYDREKFARQDQRQEKAELQSAEGLNLAYTGYVVMGDRELAIINGFEYERGEEIVTAEGYFVSTITKENVIIGQKNATEEIVEERVIPITEDPLNLYN
ncbi:hypothetical protein [Oceanidesulfovibrio marinus]|uniref:Uncharacterized protein n=2 Tax=Oceanidesulfovibrio marinus TaxID=370038 RepID=A0ABX6NDR9_9BACT|nr:hypothetical protein [Oceanidesulfovibrio marinus]QJT08381.1 hypothetical protein E8L03_05335 [Oceanidesulfovibrio marinus]